MGNVIIETLNGTYHLNGVYKIEILESVVRFFTKDKNGDTLVVDISRDIISYMGKEETVVLDIKDKNTLIFYATKGR
jgi:hypothetical protein